jgi:hypothetical protein
MAYRQYTSCVSPGNYVDFGGNLVGISNMLLLVLSMGFVAFFLASILGGPAGIWIAIALDTSFIIYFIWWLHGRLICLGGVKCLIGVITSLGPSNPLDKGGDNDFVMNLLLAPSHTNYTFPNDDYWNSMPQGELVSPNPQILAIGRGYVQGEDHKKYIVGLHCEFEGDGIYSLLLKAIIILALLIAMLIWPEATLILAIVAVVIFLLGLLGDWLLAPPSGPGAGDDPSETNLPIGNLESGDIVVVKGDWVYDSLHPGWNEIHAVHDCQKIGSMPLPAPDKLDDPTIPETPWPTGLNDAAGVAAALGEWCSAIDQTGVIEQAGSRKNPQNDWVIHPLIDGCNPVVIV